MTQEEKQLLLIDLCGRLPYGVRMLFNDSHKFRLHQINPNECAGKDGYGIIFDFGNTYSVNDCKPYLRPMSSITEEEEKEYDATFSTIKVNGHYDSVMTYKTFDWLNKKMFDYRGLIPMGLALEAPDGMYETLN